MKNFELKFDYCYIDIDVDNNKITKADFINKTGRKGMFWLFVDDVDKPDIFIYPADWHGWVIPYGTVDLMPADDLVELLEIANEKHKDISCRVRWADNYEDSTCEQSHELFQALQQQNNIDVTPDIDFGY